MVDPLDGYNVKGEVIKADSVKISSSYELVEVYLIDRLRHNQLSISPLCNAGFGVSFNAKNC